MTDREIIKRLVKAIEAMTYTNQKGEILIGRIPDGKVPGNVSRALRLARKRLDETDEKVTGDF